MPGKELKRISYFCPFCGETHEIAVVRYMAETIIKGEKIEFQNTVYYCEKEESEFTPSKLLDENLFRARETYKKKKGLLTSEEIKEIREFYGLTQKEYARLLGLGDVTVQRYETKLIQDDTYDKMMRMTGENPSFCLDLLEKNKPSFKPERYEEIKRIMIEKVKQFSEAYFIRETIRAKYVEFDSPSSKNGYCRLNLKKLEAVMVYLATYIKPLYKVKLMKLLWYLDAEYYKRYQKAMTGLVYRHLAFGAAPIAGNELMKLSGIRVSEKEIGDSSAYQILPNREAGLGEFTFEELEVLQKVVKKFGDYKTKDIVDYMHEESAYQNTEDNQIIEFSAENRIRDF